MLNKNNIRVIQLIDSLDAGGGERMAVNLANTLAEKVAFSGLVCTRKEGVLKETINKETAYFFCNKKRSIDFSAIKKTLSFLKSNNVEIVHAHGSSFFFAFLLKLVDSSLKIVWHDHHGNRVNETNHFKSEILKQVSRYFSHVFCVSNDLVEWSKTNLKTNLISHINNFVSPDTNQNISRNFKLNEPCIVCVANLRKPKNHFNLINAFKIIKNNDAYKSWKLVLVGDNKNDEYAQSLKKLISNSSLTQEVLILGQRSDVSNIVNQSKIAVLSSDVEALPMALIEYAMAKKPVVVTDVGQCAEVIGNSGKLVAPNDAKALAEAIQFYIENPTEANKDAKALHEKVNNEFNPNTIIEQVIQVYSSVI
ncbi:glycosyltransferase [Psychroflexus planctonicus]|uniref:Glycosyl transferase n=1 Tax=Psychroflexus planctonicus TaxID=1526575 RepID=A0ABQ1SEB6_9FLAO|nr:glycosyltransferase [Psychroflexus planctonicus]GGE32488.1 glycosyl transferase [Psychroflexus planctonicus]